MRVILTAVVAALVAVSPVAITAQRPAPAVQVRAIDREALSRAFSSFEARDMSGRQWRAADLSGRVVLIDFWATWCAPCLADVPWIRRARERFPPSRFVVIGVSLDTTDRRTVTAWLNRQRVDWPQVWDDRGFDGRLAGQFGVGSLPRSVLIDASGRAAATDLRGEPLLRAIARLLGD